jgi:hypothetical protein
MTSRNLLTAGKFANMETELFPTLERHRSASDNANGQSWLRMM